MMNLKYYLRGLGIGVIVTALIMGITAGRTKETLSNEEIKERARALGMVEESQVLADMLEEEAKASDGEENEPDAVSDALSAAVNDTLPEENADVSSGEEAEPAPTETADMPEDSAEPEGTPEVPENEPENEPEIDSEAAFSDEAGNTAEDTGAADDAGEEGLGESVTIEIESGEGSFIVCQKLEDAGLVPLASEFDRYLYENGYDKRINIGTYEVPFGAGFEEIAKIIAKLN